ncbi:hypothetical protein B0A70_00655 [Chryseobacterium piscicola]|uniref:Uncharacterized protein n=1 Tax=Chryseobacterium piscicola TaxID=551459 RepID=A0A2S7KJJ6_9FLAO|nr:hypothetical protein B0A70_00655 [Chryseobacterium piscicola]
MIKFVHIKACDSNQKKVWHTFYNFHNTPNIYNMKLSILADFIIISCKISKDHFGRVANLT